MHDKFTFYDRVLMILMQVKRVDCYTINIKELESFKSIFEFQCLTRGNRIFYPIAGLAFRISDVPHIT